MDVPYAKKKVALLAVHCSNATFLIISLRILSPLNISLSLGHQIGMVKPLKHTGQNIGVFRIAILISEYTSCFRLVFLFFLKSSLKLCKFCRTDHCWYQFPFLFFVGVNIEAHLFYFILFFFKPGKAVAHFSEICFLPFF